MGLTASGKKATLESTDILQRNKIGAFGCLFTSAMNIGRDVNLRELRKHLPIPDIGPLDFSVYTNTDNYFIYGDFYKSGDYWENDANMDESKVHQLLLDITGIDFEVQRFVEGDVNAKLEELECSTEEYYVIGHYSGHFFNITGYDSEQTPVFNFFDVYIRGPDDDYQQRLINNGPDELYIIKRLNLND
ncbi:MAG: hypothetical protein K6E22_02315 [Treponema sp.]|nr:hypothetical protein [Treponema sp.]